MRDRWANRPGATIDRGTVYWHVLLHAYPEARAAAMQVQEVLASFTGFHLTPPEWLHMTTLVVGSTDEITREQMAGMLSEARQLLGQVAPIPVTLDKILYHPEAIMLRVHPAETLQPILVAAQRATQIATGRTGSFEGPSPSWVPHMTVGYSTAEQPTAPIVAALGKTVQECRVRIDALTLVIQWGPERLWHWEPVGTARLQAAEVSDSALPE
ncbi:2'-5' RNA ligase family protein [Kibdelosporangium banguiense]|nr:2'-5' RNA ligase family protein [Kibdelosporangium banguiense]